jgi:glutathione S-transferase
MKQRSPTHLLIHLLRLQVSPANRDPAVIASVLKELRERTQQLEQLISSVSSEGPYGAGPTLTLADCAYPGAFL